MDVFGNEDNGVMDVFGNSTTPETPSVNNVTDVFGNNNELQTIPSHVVSNDNGDNYLQNLNTLPSHETNQLLAIQPANLGVFSEQKELGKNIFNNNVFDNSNLPSAEDVNQTTGLLKSHNEIKGDFLKSLVTVPVAAVENVISLGGGFIKSGGTLTAGPVGLLFALPKVIAGLVGIEEGIRTGSLEGAANGVKQVEDFVAPFLTYQPKTIIGQQSLNHINDIFNFFITNSAKVVGETSYNGLDYLGVNPTANAIISGTLDAGVQMLAFKTIFDGMGAIGNKLTSGEPLTLNEQVKFEESLPKTAEILDNIKNSLNDSLLKSKEQKGFLLPEDLINGLTKDKIYSKIRSGDESVLTDIEQGIKDHGFLAMEDGVKPFNLLGDLRLEKSSLAPEEYSSIKSNIVNLDSKIREVYNRNSGELGSKVTMFDGTRESNLPKEDLPVIDEPQNVFDKVSEEPKNVFETPKGLTMEDLQKRRVVGIQQAALETEKFIHDEVTGKLTKTEQDAIPFLIEGVKDLKSLNELGKPELVKFLENPSQNALNAAEVIKGYFDEQYDFNRQVTGAINYVEDWVAHIWDIPKSSMNSVSNYFQTHNPFLKKRTIANVEDGLKLGLKLKTSNIAEIIRITDRARFNSWENTRFIEGVKSLTDNAKQPLIMNPDIAPKDWKIMDNPALNKVMYGGETKNGTPFITDKPVAISPEIYNEMQIVFGKKIEGPEFGNFNPLQAATIINSISKALNFAVSMFHPWTLTEAAFESGIGLKALSLWNPVKIYKAVKNGDFQIFNEMPLAKDAINSGVVFKGIDDFGRRVVTDFLTDANNVSSKVPGLNITAKAIGKANEIYSISLWDYYHNTLKLWGYENLLSQSMKGYKSKVLTPEQLQIIKNIVGELTNNIYGGQNWDLQKIMGNPKVKQLLQLNFQSPDWTYSVLRQASGSIQGAIDWLTAKTPIEKFKAKELTRINTQYLLRSSTIIYTFLQAANFASTSFLSSDKKGRFTWENTPGHSLDVFGGYNDDGSERYIRFAKHQREILDWFVDPLKTLNSKSSPLVKIAKQLTIEDPSGGFQKIYRDEDFWNSLPTRLLDTSKLVLPFSLRQFTSDTSNNFMFTLPVSKGLTNYKLTNLYEKTLEDRKNLMIKNNKESLNDNTDFIKRLFIAGLDNNLDSEKLLKSAAMKLKSNYIYDSKDLAKDILDEFKKLDPVARIDMLKTYAERGLLTPEVQVNIKNILTNEFKVKSEQKQFGVKQ
jgi:hypothetical protein